MQKRVAVIDYGLGNVASVIGAIERVGHIPLLTNKKSEILSSDRIILPGVGAFGDGMSNLKRLGLVEIIREACIEKIIPFMGICLGMQLLANKSFEFGEHEGLGLINGDVVPFSEKEYRKIHIGWNDLEIKLKDELIFKNIENPIVYFVHSFHFVPSDLGVVIAKSKHSIDFVAGIRKGNILGLQFHPEKSQSNGLKIVQNFIEVDFES